MLNIIQSPLKNYWKLFNSHLVIFTQIR